MKGEMEVFPQPPRHLVLSNSALDFIATSYGRANAENKRTKEREMMKRVLNEREEKVVKKGVD